MKPKEIQEKLGINNVFLFKETNFNYYHSTFKENIYNYVASLPEPEIRALFEKAAKRGSNILKPCCNICIHRLPVMYEDIPGSHVSGWWHGQCGLHEDHPDISSSQHTPNPEWCPLKKKEQ